MNKWIIPSTFASAALAVIGVGLFLNFAGKGNFGASVQKISKLVTSGYGDNV